MPSRVNIYCRKSVDHIDAESIRAAIDEADLYTLAEGLDFPEGDEEDAVDAMLPHLRVEKNLDVFWKPGASRPIQIQIVDGDEAQAHLAEEREELADREDSDGAGGQRVLAHLDECRFIVYLEMSLDAPQTLCGVLAEVIAWHFAEEGEGLVWFYHSAWAGPDDWSETIWNTEG